VRRYAIINLLAVGGLTVLTMVGCTAEAKKDLPTENQQYVNNDVRVYRQPDSFPNIVFQCTDGGNGMYSTTRQNGENFAVVVTDPECDR
jgi:hypothetical protein